MSPQQHTPALPCDHCGYDLTGIVPDNAAQPHMVKCPECGKRSSTHRAPSLFADWPRFFIAIVIGSISSAAVYAIACLVFWAPQGISSRTDRGLSVFFLIAILVGGSVSTRILWRARVAFLNSDRPTRGISLRTHWFLFVDFVFYCFLITTLLAMGISIATALFQ